jgi:hypothetical protein
MLYLPTRVLVPRSPSLFAPPSQARLSQLGRHVTLSKRPPKQLKGPLKLLPQQQTTLTSPSLLSLIFFTLPTLHDQEQEGNLILDSV